MRNLTKDDGNVNAMSSHVVWLYVCVCVCELLKFENDCGERFPTKCTPKGRGILKATLRKALKFVA